MIQLTPDNLEHLAIAFGTLGSPTTEKAIIFNLSLDQRQYIPRDSQRIFDIALEQGLLIELPKGKYKINFDNAGNVIDKELIEQAAKDRIYEEQTQEHEDHLVDEQAKQDEKVGIIAEIYNDIYYDFVVAYNDNQVGF